MTRTDSPGSGSKAKVAETPRFAESFLHREDVEREAVAARRRIVDEIRALGLVERAWELDVDGYTVISPTEAGTTEVVGRVRDAALALAERRLGHPLDLEHGSDQSRMSSPFGQVQPEINVVAQDRAFEEALMNPAALALISSLLGESCALLHQSVFYKGPGPDHLPLHTDQDQASGPAPFPPYAQVANATWALTDYTVESGATCFAPGSHRLCRPPTRAEATDLDLFHPVEAEAGSIIVWHGNTWHGAFRRTAPGVRISLVEFFGRWYHGRAFGSDVTEEMYDRNPPRFRQLMGAQWGLEAVGSAKIQAAKETLYG